MAALFLAYTVAATAQADSTQTGTSQPKTILASNNLPRSADHFLLQLGYTGWQGAPDSIQTGGLPRTFNAYLMFDFPFKTNPHWSAAVGAGIATDAMYFKKSAVGLTGTTTNLVFNDLSDTAHFKKYKLATAYAEAPVELRYSTRPDESRRSVKLALGVKVGLLLNAHTKGKILESRTGAVINDYKEKLFNKRYFNKQRLAATARAGFGHFTLFGSYQLTPLFKEGVAAEIRPYTIGLTLSGL
jgi:hypothetical protein